jgi:hypothetical protein
VNPLPAGALDTHVADHATAAAVTLHTGGSGLLLGTAPDGAPATVRLFRPEPTSAVAVGGLPLAQLVAFRALAVAAHVLVETSRPGAWQTFVHLSAGTTGSIRLVQHAADEQPGTVHRPRLLLVDAGASASAEPRRVARWATALTVHEQLNSWSAPLVGSSDLALLQALTPAEARLAATALNLPDGGRELTGRPADALVVARRGGWRAAHVQLTDVEQWLIGDLGRRPAG